ncbi:MAG: sigma-70 family RNA polymerase sigma factor [Flavobacteriales bacterium]|nr:sigma-70 family RNA polymerase sigma factor [Flavobacteriales bacterium]
MNLSFDRKYDDLSDKVLLKHYKNSGDLEELGELYHRYMHLVFGVCLKYLKNKADSEDAVMNIFEKLIHDTQRFEIDNFKSWLHVTSRNFCLMQIRSGKSKAGAESKMDDMEYTIPMHHVEEPSIENDLTALEKCINKLQAEQKKCVKLFFLEDKSYRQIEEVAGYELKKVKSYIQNGKRNIKTCLEKSRE